MTVSLLRRYQLLADDLRVAMRKYVEATRRGIAAMATFAEPCERAAYPIEWCAPRALRDRLARSRLAPVGRARPPLRNRRIAHAGHEDYG